MNKTTAFAYGSLIISQIIVGANVALMKYIAPLMPVYINLCVRFILSTVALGILQLCIGGFRFADKPTDPNPYPTRTEWFYLAIMGLLGGLLFNAFMMEGVQLTSAMAAGIIVSATPALIAFFSFIILKEKMKLHQIGALFLAIGGILLLNLEAAEGPSPERTFLGDLLVFLAIVPEAFYTVVCKLLGTRLKPISVAFLVNAINVVYFLPLALMELPNWDLSLLFQDQLWLMVFCIAMGSAQFYILWQIGVTSVSAQTAALFTGLMPVGATVAAIFFLNESLTPYELMGMACVLASLFTGAGLLRGLFAQRKNALPPA